MNGFPVIDDKNRVFYTSPWFMQSSLWVCSTIVRPPVLITSVLFCFATKIAMKETLKRLQKGFKATNRWPYGSNVLFYTFYKYISLKEVQEEIILFLINMAFFVTLFATVWLAQPLPPNYLHLKFNLKNFKFKCLH